MKNINKKFRSQLHDQIYYQLWRLSLEPSSKFNLKIVSQLRLSLDVQFQDQIHLHLLSNV